MKIEVNGVEYSRFTEAIASIRLDALSNTFRFNATSKDAIPLPFKGGDSCRVLVDGEVVVTGFIELINVTGDARSHMIQIEGRDKTGDLLDSTISNLSDLAPKISLKEAIEKVIEHIGSSLVVVDLLNPPQFTKAEDWIAPEPGQNAFDYAESLARKRQALLTSSADGELVITRSSGTRVNAAIHHKVADDTNNVLQYAVSYDSTGRYNVYRIFAQQNLYPMVFAGSSDNEDIVFQSGSFTDGEVRPGRLYALLSENAGSSGQLEDRATWEADIRRARGNVYSATVHGYRNQTGNLWGVNEIINVEDDFANINSRMLVNSIQYSIDGSKGGTGKQTVISCVPSDAYTLTLAEPSIDKVGEDTFG